MLIEKDMKALALTFCELDLIVAKIANPYLNKLSDFRDHHCGIMHDGRVRVLKTHVSISRVRVRINVQNSERTKFFGRGFKSAERSRVIAPN